MKTIFFSEKMAEFYLLLFQLQICLKNALMRGCEEKAVESFILLDLRGNN